MIIKGPHTPQVNFFQKLEMKKWWKRHGERRKGKGDGGGSIVSKVARDKVACDKAVCERFVRVCDKVVCDKAVRVRELRVTKLCACVTMSCV